MYNKNFTDEQNAQLAKFEEFMPRLKSSIKGWVAPKYGLAKAEDVTQDAFLKIYNKIAEGKGPHTNTISWYYSVARNETFDFLRKKTLAKERMPVCSLNEQIYNDQVQNTPLTDKFSVKAVADVDLSRALQKELENLKEGYKTPLLMYHFQNMSYQEIADALDIGLSSAKMRIKRAREKMKEKISQHADFAL